MLSTAPLDARALLAEMESLNRNDAAPFRAFLAATIADKAAHIRFLNLLSLLEHMGSRKIMLSQMRGVLTQDILKHLAEETRHAFFFKREAEKLSDRVLEGYPAETTMAAPSGRQYFEKLDAGLTANLRAETQRETRYLWVSLVVELRAIWVYHAYQQALTDAKHPLSLKGIIAEEDRHLIDMVTRLNEIGFSAKEALPTACALEHDLFTKLFAALQKEQVPPAQAVA